MLNLSQLDVGRGGRAIAQPVARRVVRPVDHRVGIIMVAWTTEVEIITFRVGDTRLYSLHLSVPQRPPEVPNLSRISRLIRLPVEQK